MYNFYSILDYLEKENALSKKLGKILSDKDEEYVLLNKNYLNQKINIAVRVYKVNETDISTRIMFEDESERDLLFEIGDQISKPIYLSWFISITDEIFNDEILKKNIEKGDLLELSGVIEDIDGFSLAINKIESYQIHKNETNIDLEDFMLSQQLEYLTRKEDLLHITLNDLQEYFNLAATSKNEESPILEETRKKFIGKNICVPGVIRTIKKGNHLNQTEYIRIELLPNDEYNIENFPQDLTIFIQHPELSILIEKFDIKEGHLIITIGVITELKNISLTIQSDGNIVRKLPSKNLEEKLQEKKRKREDARKIENALNIEAKILNPEHPFNKIKEGALYNEHLGKYKEAYISAVKGLAINPKDADLKRIQSAYGSQVKGVNNKGCVTDILVFITILLTLIIIDTTNTPNDYGALFGLIFITMIIVGIVRHIKRRRFMIK